MPHGGGSMDPDNGWELLDFIHHGTDRCGANEHPSARIDVGQIGKSGGIHQARERGEISDKDVFRVGRTRWTHFARQGTRFCLCSPTYGHYDFVGADRRMSEVLWRVGFFFP
jgi:hypothetical protein